MYFGRTSFSDLGSVTLQHFDLRGDGKVENLQTPLLSHTWSPGLSFAKCHLEESAPYDGFTPYVAGVEAFARYARFWTRGYDVYTPTQNIVYSNYSPNPDGHDVMEWMKPWKQRLRNKSLDRIRTYLELPTAVDENLKLDNLGIYGLGKRRTLKQLDEFVGIDLVKQQSRPSTVSDAECALDLIWLLRSYARDYLFSYLVEISSGYLMMPAYRQSTIYIPTLMTWTHSLTFLCERK
jgi:hypothetical protein